MLLFVVFLSFILTLILGISNYQRNKNTLFLAAFLGILSIYNLTHYFVTVSFNLFWSAVFYVHFAPLYLLLGPMLYFFVRGTITSKSGVQKYDWLHYTPAIFQFIAFSGYFFNTPFEEKQLIMQKMFGEIETFKEYKFSTWLPQSFFYVARMVSLVIYIAWNSLLMFESKYFIFKQPGMPGSIYLKSNKKVLEWLIVSHVLIVISIGAYHLFIIHFLMDPLYLYTKGAIVYMSIGAVAILLLNLSLFFYPEILYGMKLPVAEPVSPIQSEESVAEDIPIEEDTLQLLPDDAPDMEYLEQVAEKIKAFFAKEKPYLKTDFGLAELETCLGISQQDLRNCFFYFLKIRFTDFRMKYRVEHAIQLIRNQESKNYSIEAIGQAAGFGSKSNFFQSFKKEMQMTPRQYIEILRITKEKDLK